MALLNCGKMGILTIFILSLLGSGHCAGMCGGFAIFGAQGSSSRWRYHLNYNFGRLVTYMLLGGIAGFIGGSIDALGFLGGVAHLAAIILGGFFIAVGMSRFIEKDIPILTQVVRFLNEKIFVHYARLREKLAGGHRTTRPLLIGLLSALLPCGWLYSFVAAAGATGSVSMAVLTMAIFWLGTLPIMLSIGRLTQIALQRWGLESSRITAALLIVAGLFAISGHLGYHVESQGKPTSHIKCH